MERITLHRSVPQDTTVYQELLNTNKSDLNAQVDTIVHLEQNFPLHVLTASILYLGQKRSTTVLNALLVSTAFAILVLQRWWHVLQVITVLKV